MNDLERLLLTVGDLELSRRALLERVQELEAENAELRAALNGQPEEKDTLIRQPGGD